MLKINLKSPGILLVVLSALNLFAAESFKAMEQEFRKLYRSKKFVECIEKCTEAFKEAVSERDKWETLFFRYHCYSRMKKYDEAAKITIEMQKLPEYKWRGQIFQLQCLMRQRKYTDAANLLKTEDIKDWPDNAKTQYYWEVGNANLYSKNTDEALKNYEQGIALAKKPYWKINFLRQIGNVMTIKGEFDKAVESYNKLLELSSLNDTAKCDSYVAIGNIYMRQKKYSEAEKAYTAASKFPKAHGSRIASCMVNIAAAMMRQGKKDEALKVYKQALEHKTCNASLKKLINSRIEKLEN